MYSKDDIKTLNSEKYVIENQKIFFGSRGANPESICSGIVEGALILGCINTNIVRIGSWWIISSSDDWLSAPNILNIDYNNVFKALNAFPEAGQNSHRNEFLAFVFSSALVTSDEKETIQLKGNKDDFVAFKNAIREYEKSKRILGFRFFKI